MKESTIMSNYLGNIEQLTLKNNYFRQVLYTSQHTQLVIMCLQANEEIGEEIHTVTDQFFRVEAGEGKVVINGEEKLIKDGDAIIIPAGTKHNVINTSGEKQLKLYTLYCPPHHKDGIIHQTKQIAEADTTDHL